MIDRAIEAITAQQANFTEFDATYQVGEQLKQIVRETPGAAELVVQDLQGEGMGIAQCERKIHDFADKNRNKTNCVCAPPSEADKIIREFYGIAKSESEPKAAPTAGLAINLADFL